jgi:Zn-dependent protease with chaperone function
MRRFFQLKIAYLLILFSAFFLLWGMPAAEAGLIGTKQEISIGKDVARDLEKKYGVVEDVALQERINQIGQRIVGVCDRKDLPYTFKVLNTKDINALAVPGGFIYLYKGLVDYMPSDEELAGVISHEVGHIVKRHTVHQMEKSMWTSLLFNLAFKDRGVLLQNLTYNILMADYSRDDERQADELGYLYTTRAGYNPYSMLLTLHKLKEKEGHARFGLFSTHPDTGSRIGRVEGYIQTAGIKPQVVINGNTAQIIDGSWQLPPITTAYGGYQPLYRAYFVAGKLYDLARGPGFDNQRFKAETADEGQRVQFDDMVIIAISSEEAKNSGLGPQELAEQYVERLHQWKP